ncbi:adenosylcobinamide-GDP ribazoletransferase [Ancylothrix sp. C2]|uniref:adenosylcobinamide-GDP ribazoletransferase n=1 Tax=Ancylothrix sp. D3o TaxID=2953691 RepID=UPI0021BAE4B3|nr:adenosylcobinamide-GDP ribazoletransferase [Ancylothrix sp. D3o]MCT7949084.1 adenosylcobinamide-GDP ribazoletransferase [Ancylothrix sp. D3o]
MAEIDRAVGIVVEFFHRCTQIFAAAIAFYTCLPLPPAVTLEFRGIARFAPMIGILLGGILGLVDMGLQQLGMPVLTRSALVVVLWIAITGGLHLDGVMDSADGLAVPDPQKRLQAMADSVTGAYGAMAAIALLLLKTSALHDLDGSRVLALMAAAGWGRWGQLVAINRYPYLKPTGKGAFHKDGASPFDLLPGLVLLLLLSAVQIFFYPSQWLVAVGMALGGGAIAILTGAWFNYKLGGHTGDTYGAVVEWTEALLLCLLVGL